MSECHEYLTSVLQAVTVMLGDPLLHNPYQLLQLTSAVATIGVMRFDQKMLGLLWHSLRVLLAGEHGEADANVDWVQRAEKCVGELRRVVSRASASVESPTMH